MGLVLDTTELVGAERAQRSVRDVLHVLPTDETVRISAITLSELQHGLHRAKTPAQRMRRGIFLDEVRRSIEVVPLDEFIALRVGTLDAEMSVSGERLDLADLIIAATAMETDSALVTHNLRHFERIPNLRILGR